MVVVEEDVVIVGAGVSGLTTSLGLHRYSFLSQTQYVKITLCMSVTLCACGILVHVDIFLCNVCKQS